MATYWENSCSFGLRYVSWYKYLIVSLVFSHLGFWSGNLFLIAPFPGLCLLVPFNIYNKRFCYLVEKNSFENGGESCGNNRNPELKQRRSGVSTVRPAFRLDAVIAMKQNSIISQPFNHIP